MGMNGPVNTSYSRIFPVAGMGTHTVGNVIDVEGWCVDNNFTMTGLLLISALQANIEAVEVCPAGQDLNAVFILQLLCGIPHPIAVRRVYIANTTANPLFILGMNP